MKFEVLLLACIVAVSKADLATFTVDAIKPHYQCNDTVPEGEARVQRYIHARLANKSDVIVIQDMQFIFDHQAPHGYMAFGGNCVVDWPQSVAVLVNSATFDFVAPIGDTIVGYDRLPWLPNGKASKSGGMCVQANILDGERPFTGGLLRHRSTGTELCVVAGTFPHCDGNWSSNFMSTIQEQCASKRIVIVADTNAGCPWESGVLDSKITFQEILRRHNAHWGECSDLGTTAAPTCCNDISQGKPYATLWFDRTTICGGGRVQAFDVNTDFVCGANEEHLYTKTLIDIDPQSIFV